MSYTTVNGMRSHRFPLAGVRALGCACMHGMGGLGQVTSGVRQLPRGSASLIDYQQTIIRLGAPMRSADGRIDSADSPTILWTRNFASQRGLSATGLARSSDGGLVIPDRIYQEVGNVARGGSAAVATAPAPGTAAKAGAAPGGGITSAFDTGGSSMAFPGGPIPILTEQPGTINWIPWAVGGGLLVLGVAGLGMAAAMRQNPRRGRKVRRNAGKQTVRIFRDNRLIDYVDFGSVAAAKKWIAEKYGSGDRWKKETAKYADGWRESHFGGPSNSFEIRKPLPGPQRNGRRGRAMRKLRGSRVGISFFPF